MMKGVVLIVFSYLLGSVCWGYILAKVLKKKDFGKDDLPGAAGSSRQLGLPVGILVGFLDALKGVIAVLLAKSLGMSYVVIILSSLAVVAGHNWPVFFNFKGGGGLGPTIGISICLIPRELAIALPAAITVGYIYRYTLWQYIKIPPNPVGGGVGLILLPLLSYYFKEPKPLVILTFLLLFLIGFRVIQLRCKKLKR